MYIIISMFGLFSNKAKTKLTEEKTETGIKLTHKPKKSIYSGFQVQIFPKTPHLELQKEVAISLINYLSKEFLNNELSVLLDTATNFIDCGQAFEKVICPICGKKISMDFWQESMDKAFQNGFKDLTITTNCCETITDLNSLIYQSDCGFAKSLITIIGPDTTLNESKLLDDLRSMSGVDFKLIYVKI